MAIPRFESGIVRELFSKPGSRAILHRWPGIIPTAPGARCTPPQRDDVCAGWSPTNFVTGPWHHPGQPRRTIAGALREIENAWAPRVSRSVCRCNPARSMAKTEILAAWEAAADANLRVACTSSRSGIAFRRRRTGTPATYEQRSASWRELLLSPDEHDREGVFERFPTLSSSGGRRRRLRDPVIWRMERSPPHSADALAPRIPATTCRSRVFLQAAWTSRRHDFAASGSAHRQGPHVMFGSSYPHWQCGDLNKLPKSLSSEQREKLCWRNAAALWNRHSVDLSGASRRIEGVRSRNDTTHMHERFPPPSG